MHTSTQILVSTRPVLLALVKGGPPGPPGPGTGAPVRLTFSSTVNTAALGDADVYACIDTTAARTLTISTATIAQGTPTRPRAITVTDDSGGAGTNNITIDTEGAQTVDGSATATIGGNFGSVQLLSDGSNLTSVSASPNSNATSRVSATRLVNIIEVVTTEDFGTPVSHAPSGGVMRVPVQINTQFNILNDSVVIPLFSLPPGHGIVAFVGEFKAATMVCLDNSGPVFWGTQIDQVLLKDLTFLDATNAGAGRSVTMFNLVGTGTSASRVRRVDTDFVLLKAGGDLVDIFYGVAQSSDVLLESGCTIRLNLSAVPFIGAGLAAIGNPLISNSAAPDNRRPGYSFVGTTGLSGANVTAVSLGKPSNSAFFIDQSIASGQHVFTTVGYKGPAIDGEFFRPTLVQPVTSQANADIAITSFADSTSNPGVDTTVDFGTAVDFVRGQVVLVADEAAYDGLRTIVRVAADQESFDIAVVHSTSGAGTLKMVQHTVVSNSFARDETVVMTGTAAYNDTLQTLRVDDTTFHLPQAFVTDEATGTATSTGQDEKSPYVTVQVAGAQKSSKSIGSVVVVGNTVVTDMSGGPGVWTVLNLGGLAVAGSNIELWGDVDPDTGAVTYLGIPDFSGELLGSASLTSASGNQRFQIRTVIIGSSPSPPDRASVDLSSSPMQSVPLLASIKCTTGESVRLEAQNQSGTSDLLTQDLSIVIS